MNLDFQHAYSLMEKAKNLTAFANCKAADAELVTRESTGNLYEDQMMLCDALWLAKIAASAAQLASDAMQIAYDNWKADSE